jgi:hypothetical protein
MSPNYKIETSSGSGTSIIVSNYPTLNLVLGFKYHNDYHNYIDNFSIGVWKIKK